MSFFPLFLLFFLFLVFFSIFLISQVINAILEIIQKDHPLKFSSFKTAFIITLICFIGLIIWAYSTDENLIN